MFSVIPAVSLSLAGWVALIIMLILLLLGAREYLSSVKRLSNEEKEELATGYKDLTDIGDKNLTPAKADKKLAKLKLTKEQAEILLKLFKAQQSKDGGKYNTPWREILIIALDKYIKSLAPEDDGEE